MPVRPGGHDGPGPGRGRPEGVRCGGPPGGGAQPFRLPDTRGLPQQYDRQLHRARSLLDAGDQEGVHGLERERHRPGFQQRTQVRLFPDRRAARGPPGGRLQPQQMVRRGAGRRICAPPSGHDTRQFASPLDRPRGALCPVAGPAPGRSPASNHGKNSGRSDHWWRHHGCQRGSFPGPAPHRNGCPSRETNPRCREHGALGGQYSLCLLQSRDDPARTKVA